MQASGAVRLGLLALCAALALASAPAHAYEIEDFTGAVYREGVQDETNYADEAGEHPHTGVVEFSYRTDAQGRPTGVTKDLRVDIPPGLVPNPEAFPRCTDDELAAAACPPESQVGTQARGRYCTVAPIVSIDVCTGGGEQVASKTTPFLTNPTACLGILRTHFTTTSYAGDTRTAYFDTPRGAQRCDKVPFAPSATFGSSPLQRDASAAFTAGLRVPQSTSNAALGTAHVKRVAVTLPPGATISPSAGNGLQACTDAQLAVETHDPVGCPAGSRVGSVSITSPLMPEPLTGAVYVGQPQPGSSPAASARSSPRRPVAAAPRARSRMSRGPATRRSAPRPRWR